jgi:hypothetical protein
MASLKGALGWLLLVFAWVFELALSLFLLGVGIIAWVSEGTDLNLAMLPWEGATLRRMLPILGVWDWLAYYWLEAGSGGSSLCGACSC